MLTTPQIDVRDLSTLLLLSLTTPAAANKRFVVGHPSSYRIISNELRAANVPGVTVAKENETDNLQLPRLDTSEVEAAFPGFKLRSLQTMVTEVERRLKA